MHRKIGAALAALAVGLAGALALAGPAQAADDTWLPTEPWQAWDTHGDNFEQDPSDLSHIVSPWKALLEWEAGDSGSDKGTSIETPNLGLEVEDGTEVSFQFKPQEGADCAGGAPRVFVVIDGVNTNSWDQNQPAGEQCGENDTVTFVIHDGGTIGLAGLVYDNSVPGVVKFRNLTIGDKTVLFAEVCEWDKRLAADDEKCVDPDPEPTEEPTDEPTEEPTETESPAPGKGGGDDDDKPGLPVTGAALPILGGVGAGAAVLGTVLFLVGRKRRSQFAAE